MCVSHRDFLTQLPTVPSILNLSGQQKNSLFENYLIKSLGKKRLKVAHEFNVKYIYIIILLKSIYFVIKNLFELLK